MSTRNGSGYFYYCNCNIVADLCPRLKLLTHEHALMNACCAASCTLHNQTLLYGAASVMLADVVKKAAWLVSGWIVAHASRPWQALHHRRRRPRNSQPSIASATMSASTQSSATIDSHDEDALSVEALFLIKFDKKVGYVMRCWVEYVSSRRATR